MFCLLDHKAINNRVGSSIASLIIMSARKFRPMSG
jgi:hypothetical protein